MFKSDIFRKITIVIAGSAAGQLITLLFMPVLTRVYSPSVIGTQSLFMSIATMLMPLGSLAFSLAIIRTDNEDDCKKVVSFCFSIASFVSICIFLVFYFFYEVNFLSWRDVLGGWLFAIPLYIFLFSSVDIIKKKSFKEGNVTLVSKYNIISSMFLNGSKSIGGYFSPTGNMILASLSICTLGTLIWFWIRASIKVSWCGFLELKSIFIRFSDFPKYRCPQMLINSLSQSLPLFFITGYYDLDSAGQYSLAWAVLIGPINLIGQSISNVLYPAYSELEKKEDSLKRLFVKNTVILTSIVLLIPILFPIFPLAFSFVFGGEWVEAGQLAKFLFLLCVFIIISKPSISIIPVINAQKYFFIFEVISFILKFSTLFICALFDVGVTNLVISYAIVGSLMYIILTISTYLNLIRFEKTDV